MFFSTKYNTLSKRSISLTTKKNKLWIGRRTHWRSSEDIHGMLCDQNNDENYQGLDSNHDTEAEVKTAVQLYPNAISQRIDLDPEP